MPRRLIEGAGRIDLRSLRVTQPALDHRRRRIRGRPGLLSTSPIASSRRRRIALPARVTEGFGIATDIGIGIHPSPITFQRIGRQEAAHHRIVVARTIVVQPGDTIVILPGEAFGGAHTPLLVARGAIGTVDLVALHYRAIGHRADGLDHAAQCIGQEHVGRGAIELADEQEGSWEELRNLQEGQRAYDGKQ